MQILKRLLSLNLYKTTIRDLKDRNYNIIRSTSRFVVMFKNNNPYAYVDKANGLISVSETMSLTDETAIYLKQFKIDKLYTR